MASRKRVAKRKGQGDLQFHGPLKKHLSVVPTDVPGSRRLIVMKQPNTEFYKDEGGKSNFLTTTVTLVEYDENGKLFRTPSENFVPVPLKATLYFESEVRVEDRDQDILRLVGNEFDELEIKPESRSAIIKFRLEKVSRRKDGQRFKLKIEVDTDKVKGHPWAIAGTFTNPICVLSKRKTHGDGMKNNKMVPGKVTLEDLARFETRMNSKLEALQSTLGQLVSALQAQAETISTLQAAVGTNSQVSHRPGLVLQCDPSVMKKGDKVPISPCSPKSFLTDESDYATPCRIEADFLMDDDFERSTIRKQSVITRRLDRILPSEMQFNFGVPSSPVSYTVEGSLVVE